MEDEEEDCGRTLEDRGSLKDTLSSGESEIMPLVQTVPRCRLTGSSPAPPSGTTRSLQRPLHSTVGLGLVSSPTGSAEETRALIQSLIFCNEDFPAMSEPNPPAVREDNQEEEDDEERPEHKEDEDQEVLSVEVQIGRKLREIGDQFQQEHLETFLQYQRGQLPVWWRLASTLYDFLFPGEAAGPGRAQR